MKYGKLTPGQVEAVVNKMGGMEGVKRFLSGDSVIKEIERKFKTWKTIKLGTGLKTAEDFRYALRDGGFELNDQASGMLGKPIFTAATEESEMDLIKVTVAELGFKEGARYDQIYERAKELGLELCPPEVGPQLRLQYQRQDREYGERILIAMEPIIDSDGDPRLFLVESDRNGLKLNSLWGYPGSYWSDNHQFVFCRSCK